MIVIMIKMKLVNKLNNFVLNDNDNDNEKWKLTEKDFLCYLV